MKRKKQKSEPPKYLGYKWWLSIIGITAIGFIILYSSPAFPNWITRTAPYINHNKWHILISIYIFAVVGSHIIIHFVTLGFRNLYKLEGTTRVNLYTPAFIGFCEAILYPTSFILKKPEFIGIWLAVKVAGNWNLWGKGDEGRRRFNMFLVGNALSIMIGFITYGAIISFVILNE